MWEYNQTNTLAHTGVRGMHWGHRKSSVNSSETGSTKVSARKELKAQKKLAKQDKKWEKQVTSTDTYLKVYNNAANKVNSQLDAFNAKWSKVNMNDPKLAAYNKRYENAYGKMWDKMLQQSVDELIKTNPSGTKKMSVKTYEPGGFPELKVVDNK